MLVCTLGLSILSATRDLAVALVDVTQHVARLDRSHRAPCCCRTNCATIRRPSRWFRVARAIAFDNVSFPIPAARRCSTSFSVDIAPGQRVGLVGPSGGGKSTLFGAAAAHYTTCKSGRILIDGHDIARATQDSLRAAISFVPQDISLLHRSLMENIRYGRASATDEEVWEAARAASCGPFIERLPDGLETIVGDRGVKLSGGQRQRIAIARAFLKDAPLLLFDEATVGARQRVRRGDPRGLARLMAGRTVIVIAHRLATLRDFDRILVLDAGRLAEDGPPDQLARRDGFYGRLVNSEIGRLKPSRQAA